jgi:hypothetical protein
MKKSPVYRGSPLSDTLSGVLSPEVAVLLNSFVPVIDHLLVGVEDTHALDRTPGFGVEIGEEIGSLSNTRLLRVR